MWTQIKLKNKAKASYLKGYVQPQSQIPRNPLIKSICFIFRSVCGSFILSLWVMHKKHVLQFRFFFCQCSSHTLQDNLTNIAKKVKKKHTHTDIPLLTLCTTFRLGHIRTYIAPRFRFWRTLKIAAHLKVSQRCWWRWPWSGALATFKSGKIQELHLPMVTKCLLIGGVIGLLVFSLYYYKSFFFLQYKVPRSHCCCELTESNWIQNEFMIPP